MILAFDTSCDDTSVAILKSDGSYINIISSQDDIHRKLGGVVPELAARRHSEVIAYLTKEALERAKAELSEIKYIAVTVGPGLLPSLLVGVAFAKSLAYSLKLPVVPVNHIEGHIFAPFFKRGLKFPFISLVVSGGHTHLFLVRGVGEYELIGRTLDDAVGEAFDKVARVLSLGYPGGPEIDKLSKSGNPYRFKIPQGLKFEKSFNFSFSGVKTYVKNLVNKMGVLSKTDIADIAASFQKASIDILLEKTVRASRELGVNIVSVSGGVSANSYLRGAFERLAEEQGFELVLPKREMTTDNALMIAYRASLELDSATFDYSTIEADPSLSI